MGCSPRAEFQKEQQGSIMGKLVVLLAVSTVLAYYSQQNTVLCYQTGTRYRISQDWAYIALVTVLVFFSGLRTGYNDTWNYINGFRNAPFLGEYLQGEDIWDPFSYPAFYFLRSFFKSVADKPNLFIFITSAFVQICFLRFLKRYATNFTFSVFLYITLGTFCFTMAALKQVIAMAILMTAIPFLERKQWVRYYLLVFLAMTFHTYALAYAVLPLFRTRPWKLFTFLFIGIIMTILVSFESVITSFLDSAEEMGKTIAQSDILNNTSLNLIRVMVYAVPPLMSLVLRRWLFHDSLPQHHILVHMSIISAACMLLGTQNGANVFARMGTYFEPGMLCCLPWMIPRSFTKKSAQLVTTVSVILFLGYFFYEFAIAKDFGNNYTSITILEFLRRMLA